MSLPALCESPKLILTLAELVALIDEGSGHVPHHIRQIFAESFEVLDYLVQPVKDRGAGFVFDEPPLSAFGRDLGEPFDFLTWFEYAPAYVEAFEELVGKLRETEGWTYVEREVDIRLIRDGHP